jgi:hypothetical protein
MYTRFIYISESMAISGKFSTTEEEAKQTGGGTLGAPEPHRSPYTGGSLGWPLAPAPERPALDSP